LNPQLNAFITVMTDQALAQACDWKTKRAQAIGAVPCTAFRSV
jgi:hypothetical protein